ncbi:hyaluronan-binding protein 2-like isoform X2 [Xyrauchen texanus]|uniref:hyaluronan-binding protein 2-like isoform X2 n=1 Tax=Xyrauchen texanus TaxID=154827 RepID=UPI0022423489|nr:hyaluronan-binding protein 2-like isoform X2 [Xyrauchen texanus]
MNLKLWLLLLFLCAVIVPAQLRKDKHNEHDRNGKHDKHERHGEHGHERHGEHGHGRHGKDEKKQKGRVKDLIAESDVSDDSSDDDDDPNDWLFELQDVRGKCTPNPCLNGGDCEEKRNTFKCHCSKKFSGRICQRSKRVCMRGTCGKGLCLLTKNPPYYACKCIPPFLPPNCEIPSPCTPNPCENNGKCVKDEDDFDCICKNGFKGKYCKVDPNDCYEGDGESYRGKVSETEERDECLDWNSEFVLDMRSFPSNAFASSTGLGPHNYCRNPDGDKKPWCFIKRNKRLRWDYCVVRKCPPPATTTAKMSITTAKPQLITAEPPGSTTPKVTPTKPSLPETANTSQHFASEIVPTNSEAFTTPESTTSTKGILSPQLTISPHNATSLTRDFATCGKPQTKKQQNRIYGGLKAIPGSHPWQASLQVKPKGSTQVYSHICGGTLIKSCWVLTAAHCIGRNQDYRVVLGGVNLGGNEPADQTLQVEKTIVHEKFKETPNVVYNDIALLKLKATKGECAKETQFVKTACLTKEPFEDGKECSISGWGATELYYGSLHLLDAQVLLISQEACSSNKAYAALLDDGMFCAGYLKGGVDSCQGDSGGALTCERNQTHYVYGIVSWGDSCGKKGKPGVYTRVLKYMDWINKKTAEGA